MKIIKENKVIIISIIVIIAFVSIFIKAIRITRDKDEDTLVFNKNVSFNKQQKIKGIVFKNIKCTFDGKDSLIRYKIVNTTKKTVHLKNYDIYVKDKDKNIITKIAANVEQTIKSGKEIEMANHVVGVDLSNAYYMELEVKVDKENK